MTLQISAVVTLVAALSFVLSPQAMAQACQGRPGASAIEQYCEAIPEGTGQRVTPSRERESRGSTRGVPAATARKLVQSGEDGQAVLGLAASRNGGGGGSSSSGSGSRSTGSPGAGGTANVIPAATSPSDNPLKAVSSAVSNGATVGSAFLSGLVALTFGAAAAGWFGFRRHEPSSES